MAGYLYVADPAYRWEGKTEGYTSGEDPEPRIKRAGLEGWELVQIVPAHQDQTVNMLVFKRRLIRDYDRRADGNVT